VIVSATQASNKIGIETEQADERVDIIATVLDNSARPMSWRPIFQLTVPEEAELQLRTQTGLVYVEQVMGDMTLQSVPAIFISRKCPATSCAHTGGSLVCHECAGKPISIGERQRAGLAAGLTNHRCSPCRQYSLRDFIRTESIR